ncbi:MAG: hypothetical protein H0X37_17435 [Herpetosiphonaceae bacterium]|nr:hypothetical protein [Herpetosiphonaceae bacterium]
MFRKSLLGGLLFVLLLTSACGGSGATAAPAGTPDPRLSKITITATQTHLLGSDVSVVGTIRNDDTAAHDITLQAVFHAPNGAVLGNVEGIAEDVAAGKTANFEINGKVDSARYGTTEVSIVSLREQK